jgi:LuxR family maltose regulon positive regulatory protein
MVAFWQNDMPQTFAHARQALDLLDEHDLPYRSVILLYTGQEQLFAGRVDGAQRLLMEAYTLFEVTQNIHGRLAATMGLGDLCFLQTELEGAAHYYQQVLDGAVGGEEMLDDQSYALSGLSAIAYERDELELAEQQALHAHELARRRHSEMLMVRSALSLSLVRQARGQIDQARRELQALAAQIRNAQLLRELHSGQARLALAMGDREAAQRWRAAVLAQGAPVSQLHAEREALTIASIQLAQGEAQAALVLLERWRADAAAQGRTRSEVEILALQALAHGALADPAAAVQALTRALALGQPRGLRRIFLDLGEPLARLVQDAAPSLGKRPLAAYAATLLRALMPGQAGTPQTVVLPLLEPLSPQEQRVLRMIVAGRSNPEIARELVVSANTVKTHVKNIYRKLNVGTREEAQAAARELHLR